MPRTVPVFHPDLPLEEVRRLERAEKCAELRRRIQAIRLILEGGRTRKDIAAVLGVKPIVVSRWVQRFNEGGVEGLRRRPGQGRKRKLDDQQVAIFESWVANGPDPVRDGHNTWSAPRLKAKVLDEFGIEVSEGAIFRLLKALGFRHRKGRKIPGKADPHELAEFKKTWKRSAESGKRSRRFRSTSTGLTRRPSV